MSVKIHGKEYRTVAERVNLFHEEHKDVVKSVKTKIIYNDEKFVVMRTTIKIGDCVYHGHAQEVYGSSHINETSALENCETSAIGRALASAGFGGTEFASADEVANAIMNQSTGDFSDKKNKLVWSEETREGECSLKKHKGEKWSDVPSNYLDWMANKSSLGEELKMFATAELLFRAGKKEAVSTDSTDTVDDDPIKTSTASDSDDALEKALQEDGEPTTADDVNELTREGTRDDLAREISDIADRIGLETFKEFKGSKIGDRKFSECSIDELIKLINELNETYPDDGLPT